MPPMKSRKSTRWDVSRQSMPTPAVRPRPMRLRSHDREFDVFLHPFEFTPLICFTLRVVRYAAFFLATGASIMP
jgi:hypothetical protein